MRICVLHNYLGEVIGGVERALSSAATGLSQRGHDLIVCNVGRHTAITSDVLADRWADSCAGRATDLVLAQNWMVRAISLLGDIAPGVPVIVRWDGLCGISDENMKMPQNVVAQYASSYASSLKIGCPLITNGCPPFDINVSDNPDVPLSCVRATRDTEWKRVLHVEILSEILPDHQFVVAGCDERELENVHYVGKLDLNLLFREVYSRSQIALCTTVDYDEGIPNSLIEPMSIGVVPITYQTGEVAELVTDGWNGFIVPSGDLLAMAQRIKQLDQDRDLWRLMSKRAKTTIEEKFSMDTYLDNLEELMKSVVGCE